MKKKLILFLTGSAFVAAAVLQGLSLSSEKDLFDLNVEALSETEFTHTTWTCNGSNGVCSASCHQCGTKVAGTGRLKGEHSCFKE